MKITKFYSDNTMKLRLVMNDEIYKEYKWVSRYEEIKALFNIKILDSDTVMNREVYQELTPDCVCNSPLPINNTEDVVLALAINIKDNDDFQDFFEEYELSKIDDCDCEDDDCDCFLYLQDTINIELEMELISFSINNNLIREYMINEYKDVLDCCRNKDELESMLNSLTVIRNEWTEQLGVSKDMANRIIPHGEVEECYALSIEIQRNIGLLQSIVDKIEELNFKDNKVYQMYQRKGAWAVISDYDYIRDFESKYMMEERDYFYNGKVYLTRKLEDSEYYEEVLEIKVNGMDIDNHSILDRYIKDKDLVSGIVIIKEEDVSK